MARAWYEWLTVLVQNWPEQADHDHTENQKRAREERRTAKSTRLHEKKPHRIWNIAGRLFCAACNRSTRTASLAKRFRASPCQAFVKKMPVPELPAGFRQRQRRGERKGEVKGERRFFQHAKLQSIWILRLLQPWEVCAGRLQVHSQVLSVPPR